MYGCNSISVIMWLIIMWLISPNIHVVNNVCMDSIIILSISVASLFGEADGLSSSHSRWLSVGLSVRETVRHARLGPGHRTFESGGLSSLSGVNRGQSEHKGSFRRYHQTGGSAVFS